MRRLSLSLIRLYCGHLLLPQASITPRAALVSVRDHPLVSLNTAWQRRIVHGNGSNPSWGTTQCIKQTSGAASLLFLGWLLLKGSCNLPESDSPNLFTPISLLPVYSRPLRYTSLPFCLHKSPHLASFFCLFVSVPLTTTFSLVRTSFPRAKSIRPKYILGYNLGPQSHFYKFW